MPTRSLTATALALLLLTLAAAPAAAGSRPASPQAQAKRSLAQLVADTRKLPSSAIKRRDKAALLRAALRIRRLSTSNPCRAIARLGTYRRLLAKVRRPRGQLESDALAVNVALVGHTGARRCGGGAKGRPTVTEATARVMESDERHLRLRVSLPAPTFASEQVGGTEYQQMFMEGMGETGGIGEPGLPTVTEFFAVPEGANVSVKVNGTTGYELDGVNLMPHQPEPVDQELEPIGPGGPPRSDFLSDPFVKSSRAYRSRRPFPAKPAASKVLGKQRDVRIGGVDTNGGAYRARSRTLHIFTSIDVTVNFSGDNKGHFGSAKRITSPWESFFEGEYARTFVNWDTVRGKLDLDDLDPEFCGEDMLVVTSPTLKPAADAFAAARGNAGYVTRVSVVGDDPGQIGSTRAQIQAHILGELNAACELRPSYAVLFGDTSHVPTWNVPCTDGGDVAECDIATDLPYSLNFPSDLFADIKLGRIPAHDLAAANAVVNKIVGYETTPPAPPGDDFYYHSTVTAYFEPKYNCILNEGQEGEPNCKSKNGPVTGHYELDTTNTKDTRGFTRTAEKIQNAMTADGITTDRVYTTLEQITPEFYYNGDPIPDALRKPTFPWNGTGADLLAHYNEGRSLILHRDHGWHGGWADPTLHSGDVPSMVNGTQLPVVFGVDCSSAQFDIPGVPSFVEQQVMKPEGGAFAGFGDTRVSPTWANNNMAFGFFDAIFPDVSPSYGSPDAKTRLGSILLSGKGFMATKNGVGYQSAAATYQEHFLYHLLGDPSAQVWIDLPKDIVVERIQVERIPIPVPDPGGPVFKVLVNMGDQGKAGTVVTLTRNGQAIGRGVLGGAGTVEITPEIATPSDGLKVEFEQDGALPDEKAIDDAPAPQPAGPADTALTMRCPGSVRAGLATTFAGNLDPAFAGAQVKLRYTRTGATTPPIEHTVATNASGDWADSVTFPRTQTGQWRVTATYEGDASHKPSAAQCDINVTTR